MFQQDLFNKSSEDYLYSELNKTQNSMERQFRAVFALLTELQKKYNALKGCENKGG